jgi:iron(III) transport system permease protein
MAFPTLYRQSLSLQMLATYRRFIRWLTSAKVVLALIMLALMTYLILIPLFRMLQTTVTYQEKDARLIPDAVLGQLTAYHWMRMLTGEISEVLTYAPLQHSLVVSVGATLLALIIGSTMAWMVIRTDMPGRNIINALATVPYIMPSWTIAQAWTVMFKNRTSGGTAGIYEGGYPFTAGNKYVITSSKASKEKRTR